MSPELLDAPQTISWPSPSPTGPSQIGRAIRDEVERELKTAAGQAQLVRDDAGVASTAERWTDALASLALLRSGKGPLISYSTASATLEEVPRFADYQRENFGERSFCLRSTNPSLRQSWLRHLHFAHGVAPESLSKTLGLPVMASTGYFSQILDRDALLSAVTITAGRSGFSQQWGADPVERSERPQSNPAMPRLAAALREGRLDGQGLPRAGMRKLRYVDEVDHPTTEADQIGFGRTGVPPADMHRRSRR
jgi:hypothetical protein